MPAKEPGTAKKQYSPRQCVVAFAMMARPAG
jgi:hypothetical protein